MAYTYPDAGARRSVFANAAYRVLDPIPFGCFAAALAFDIIYMRSADVFWNRGSAWLLFFGLVAAIVPRFINLAQVWITSRRSATGADRLDFWLNVFAIVAAVFDSLVHSRDAYAVVPAGMWLSACTVALLVLSHALLARAGGAR